jgi:type II secretory ATPase GspE/PulE/Tfp pilus assembly ATPase PilB-like protein
LVGSPSPLRIGELLCRSGLIDHDDLALALSEQELTSDSPPLGRVLLRLGAIDEATLTVTLAEQFGMRVVDLDREGTPEPSALARISREAAHRLLALPLRYEDGQLVVVVADPPTRETQREILKLSGRQPVFVLATGKTLAAAIDEWFPHPSMVVDDPSDGSDAIVDVELRRDDTDTRESRAPVVPDDQTRRDHTSDLLTVAGVRVDDPVVAWLLDNADEVGATSVHLVEDGAELHVRVRVDGEMHESAVLPPTAGTILVRRVLGASGIRVDARGVQRGSIPAVPGIRDDWQVRSQPTASGRCVILRPTTPVQ